MPDKDIISKTLLKRMAVDMATILFGLEIADDPPEVIETQTQRIEERRADLVVKLHLKNPHRPFILHVEIQNDNQALFPIRMLRYYTDIALLYPKIPIEQYMIYIGKDKLTMPRCIQTDRWCYEYQVLDIRDIDCFTLIERDTPESLVLAILCDFKDRPKQDVVNFIVKRLKQLLAENESEFRNYMKMLEIYSKNRALETTIKEAEAMLSRYDETTMPSYELGWEAAERKYKAIEEEYKLKLEQERQQREIAIKQAQEAQCQRNIALAMRLMERQFDTVTVSNEVKENLSKLTAPQAEALVEAVFDFSTLGELKAWLEKMG